MKDALDAELELDDAGSLEGMNAQQRRDRALDLLEELLDCVGGIDRSLTERVLNRIIVILSNKPGAID